MKRSPLRVIVLGIALLLVSTYWAAPAQAHELPPIIRGFVVVDIHTPIIDGWKATTYVRVRGNPRTVSYIDGVCMMQMQTKRRVWKNRPWPLRDGYVYENYWDSRGQAGYLRGSTYATAEPWAAATLGTHRWRAVCTVYASGPDGSDYESVVGPVRTLTYRG